MGNRLRKICLFFRNFWLLILVFIFAFGTILTVIIGVKCDHSEAPTTKRTICRPEYTITIESCDEAKRRDYRQDKITLEINDPDSSLYPLHLSKAICEVMQSYRIIQIHRTEMPNRQEQITIYAQPDHNK